MRVLIGFQTASLDEVLGIGGEATVYRFGDRAVKIFHDQNGLEAKVKKLGSFPRGLPPEVVAPEELVLDAASHTAIGYAMPAVKGARALTDLMKKNGAPPASEVSSLFTKIHDVLSALHARRVIAGDLNDGNLLFAGPRPWFIDVDSMQLPGHPCTVAHERYLDPGLYGADLSARCCFTEKTDWYAFAVLLFNALLYVHPYGGVHPKHATLLRRAQHRVSVFDPSVKLPKSAQDWRSLPAPLIDGFRAIFERGERGVFPRDLLRFTWAAAKAAPPPPAIYVNRTCRAIPIARLPDGLLPNDRFREREGWLLEGDRRVGRVLEGQTFLRAGRRLGFGFYRAGLVLIAFLFKPGRAGLIDVKLPSFTGRLISADAVFDDHHAVVSFLFDHHGVRCGALHLIRDDGAVVGSLEGPVESERILASTSGRAVQGGMILAATDEGLVLLGAEQGRITARTIFTDTEPFVEEGAQIHPGPNGTVYVVVDRDIKQLEIS